ncbi:hypothetical protein M4I32_06330 [Microbacterium sp. LRZ72]|uniref:hypothetical protein n=1 Tax=Microbacterium sp. LRZ72 TaxID=2942481 RepID=UPI0029BFA8AD|nr:hypothetical protein [Microbacterium sp. LRZ72]MDX2376413.1 hypothetical protein [Microbacterium sp. LRZ72]
MSTDPTPAPDAVLVAQPRTVVPPLDDPVARARAELKAALAAIEEKANVPRRIAFATDRFTVKARAFARRQPVLAIGAAVGAAAVAGVAVWGAVFVYTAPRR